MNPFNYASLEASRRLAQSGIGFDQVEMMWTCIGDNADQWELTHEPDPLGLSIPAPSIAELWQQLPAGTRFVKETGSSEASVIINARQLICVRGEDPLATLIDFLISVKECENEEEEASEPCLASSLSSKTGPF